MAFIRACGRARPLVLVERAVEDELAADAGRRPGWRGARAPRGSASRTRLLPAAAGAGRRPARAAAAGAGRATRSARPGGGRRVPRAARLRRSGAAGCRRRGGGWAPSSGRSNRPSSGSRPPPARRLPRAGRTARGSHAARAARSAPAAAVSSRWDPCTALDGAPARLERAREESRAWTCPRRSAR